jgi:hypothetical protein
MPRPNKPALRTSRATQLAATPDILAPGEFMEDWRQFHDAVLDNLHAQGALECSLASRAAGILWRLSRVVTQESALIAHNDVAADNGRKHKEWLRENARRMREITGKPMLDPDDIAADIEAQDASETPMPVGGGRYLPALVANELFREPPPPRLLPDEAPLRSLSRYESHLNRQLARTLALLSAMQDRRLRHASVIETTADSPSEKK